MKVGINQLNTLIVKLHKRTPSNEWLPLMLRMQDALGHIWRCAVFHRCVIQLSPIESAGFRESGPLLIT